MMIIHKIILESLISVISLRFKIINWKYTLQIPTLLVMKQL